MLQDAARLHSSHTLCQSVIGSVQLPSKPRKMSAAADDRKSSVEGTPMGGGPVKGAAEITGGYLNYTFIVLNLILSWLGFFLVLCSLSALQNQINKHQDIQTNVNDFYVSQTRGPENFHAYAVNAGYPALPPGRLLRFEWFVFFLTLVTLSIVNLALIGRITRQTRSMMVGYMAVNLALAIYSTNRIYDLSHFSGHGKYYHSARATFTGFIFLDIGFFGLIYLLGLEF
ncbi:TPA: hypothetical protein ACH3X1_010613 [Trebouxia sp. C0004]